MFTLLNKNDKIGKNIWLSSKNNFSDFLGLFQYTQTLPNSTFSVSKLFQKEYQSSQYVIINCDSNHYHLRVYQILKQVSKKHALFHVNTHIGPPSGS